MSINGADARIVRELPVWLSHTARGNPRHYDVVDRDVEVLHLISLGFPYAEIAEMTFESRCAIKLRLSGLRVRAGARTTTHLVRMATEAGLFATDDADGIR